MSDTDETNTSARPTDPATGPDNGPATAQPADPAIVTSLDPSWTGRWLITSRGSTHVLDLDAYTYERRPGPTSQPFLFDNQTSG
jgi:hypothetical protein